MVTNNSFSWRFVLKKNTAVHFPEHFCSVPLIHHSSASQCKSKSEPFLQAQKLEWATTSARCMTLTTQQNILKPPSNPAQGDVLLPEPPRLHGCRAGLYKSVQAHRCKGLDETGKHLYYLFLSQHCSPLPLHRYKTRHWFSQAQKHSLKFQMVDTDYSHTTRITVVVKCKHVREGLTISVTLGTTSAFTSHFSEIQSNSKRTPKVWDILLLSGKNRKKKWVGQNCMLGWCFWGWDGPVGVSQFSSATLQWPWDQPSLNHQPPALALGSDKILLSVAAPYSTPYQVCTANGRHWQHLPTFLLPRMWDLVMGHLWKQSLPFLCRGSDCWKKGSRVRVSQKKSYMKGQVHFAVCLSSYTTGVHGTAGSEGRELFLSRTQREALCCTQHGTASN